jgi:hypothetical protein
MNNLSVFTSKNPQMWPATSVDLPVSYFYNSCEIRGGDPGIR